jgi:hypothetical protein
MLVFLTLFFLVVILCCMKTLGVVAGFFASCFGVGSLCLLILGWALWRNSREKIED